MNITELEIKGAYLIENFEFYDNRGGFVKTFSEDLFKDNGISLFTKEIYYSISHKNVIRGMHFQVPPYEHSKLVYVTAGRIMDVILDIRKKSSTFGKAIQVEIEVNRNSVYVPVGCAHGFKCLEDNSIVVYNQTSCYSKEHDAGIRWNSFGFDWNVSDPIISERDKSFTTFNNLITPF